MKKVLIIDDDEMNLRLIEVILKKELASSVCVEKARDGIEGLKKAEAKNYDLIFLNISMPRTDGFLVLGELRKMECYKKTPIISVTCLSHIKMEILKSGFDKVIIKPFRKNEIFEALL